MNYKKIVVISLLYQSSLLFSYGLPSVNLGFTNILDGGPVRPVPGFYLQHFSIFYHTKHFLNFEGKPLPGLDGTASNIWTYVFQFIYQFNKTMNLRGMPGISATLPFTFLSHTKPNALKIKDAGGGPGNLTFGPYMQWAAIFFNDRPIFIHRLSLDLGMPSLRNKLPEKQVNPGDAFFTVRPSWSGTLYLQEDVAFSWRLMYVWSQKNRKIDFKAGDAVALNYSLEYQLIPHLWTAICGYYLQQISDNKANGLKVPHSRERVFGLGPGAGYFFSRDLVFFGYFYAEFKAINREQGVSFTLRLVNHF